MISDGSFDSLASRVRWLPAVASLCAHIMDWSRIHWAIELHCGPGFVSYPGDWLTHLIYQTGSVRDWSDFLVANRVSSSFLLLRTGIVEAFHDECDRWQHYAGLLLCIKSLPSLTMLLVIAVETFAAAIHAGVAAALLPFVELSTMRLCFLNVGTPSLLFSFQVVHLAEKLFG